MDGINQVLETMVDRHADEIAAQTMPPVTDISIWNKEEWLIGAPGDMSWIGAHDGNAFDDLNAIRQLYVARYQEQLGGPRKIAAANYVAAVVNAFNKTDPGVESLDALQLCPRTYQSPIAEAFGLTDNYANTNDNTLFANAQALSAGQALQWVDTTCQFYQNKKFQERVALAVQRSNVEGVLSSSPPLGVRAPDGVIQPIDGGKLVRSAAVDGFQVTFSKGFIFSDTLSISPFGRSSPSLDAKLSPVTRADGMKFLGVEGLQTLPGLDGPLATLLCLSEPGQDAYGNAELTLAAGVLDTFNDAFGDGALMTQEARDEMQDAATCGQAKEVFLDQAE